MENYSGICIFLGEKTTVISMYLGGHLGGHLDLDHLETIEKHFGERQNISAINIQDRIEI